MKRKLRCTCSCHDGLSRFADWVPDLPHNIYPTNVDFLLHVNGRLLMAEFKRAGEKVSVGQRWALQVASCHEGGHGKIEVFEAHEQDSGLVAVRKPPYWDKPELVNGKEELGERVLRWAEKADRKNGI